METVKKDKQHTFFKKKSGRYGVQNSKGAWLNGDEKRDLLVEHGFIKLSQAGTPPAAEADVADSSEGTESAE